ncbi:MAG: hypothetical protein GXP55_03115 [Deltaproteobacteria bacterium]|nr:hypothetical protein [Deltaproteobacteria bacterium]
MSTARMLWTAIVTTSLLTPLVPTSARAQGAAALASPSQDSADEATPETREQDSADEATPETPGEQPRIIHLRRGGFLRGVVIRRTDDTLVVRRIDGETVRIPRADVARTAPMNETPRPRERRIRVHFVSDRPGVALDMARGDHQRFVLANSGSPPVNFGTASSRASQTTVTVQTELASDRERVCIAPCSFEVAPGRYRFALAIGNQLSHPSPPFELRAPTELRGIFESHRASRRLGAILALSSPLIAVATFAMIFLQPDLAVASFAIGTTLFVGSAISGFVLLLREDQTRFESRPLSRRPRAPRALMLAYRRAL